MVVLSNASCLLLYFKILQIQKRKENSSQALDSAIMLTPLYYTIICRFNITILSILNAETSVHEVASNKLPLCSFF